MSCVKKILVLYDTNFYTKWVSFVIEEFIIKIDVEYTVNTQLFISKITLLGWNFYDFLHEILVRVNSNRRTLNKK